MGLRDRVRTMGFGLPDMGKLTDMFNDKFDRLIAKLDEILIVLQDIRRQNIGGGQ
jgi:hypothetical protein